MPALAFLLLGRLALSSTAPTSPAAPQLVSLRTISVEDGGTFDWHSHPFEEFTLVTDHHCLIGYPPGWQETDAPTLLHYRQGERHGAWVSPRWHLVNDAGSKPSDELKELYAAPNYDSARHAFRKTFGCSPREMLQRLRMAHAKNLLLESTLSIKEIAGRVGYAQQHDFNRVFRRSVGAAPSKWRDNPLVRSTGA